MTGNTTADKLSLVTCGTVTFLTLSISMTKIFKTDNNATGYRPSLYTYGPVTY